MWDQVAVAALLPGLPACLGVGFRPPVAVGGERPSTWHGGGCDDMHPKRVVALGQIIFPAHVHWRGLTTPTQQARARRFKKRQNHCIDFVPEWGFTIED
ncbi:hypothetical protein EJB05_22794, partial [Eragrostis curvula]